LEYAVAARLVIAFVVSTVSLLSSVAIHWGRSTMVISNILCFFDRGSRLIIGIHNVVGVKTRSGDNFAMTINIFGIVVQSVAGPAARCTARDVALYMFRFDEMGMHLCLSFQI
jgi:hypothetical protein